MDTAPPCTGSDSETVKDKVKLVKIDLSDFNKNTVQCWECECTFKIEPLWGINQMNTRRIQCKVCKKFFLIKAALKAEPKYDNGLLEIESLVSIYTAGEATGVKNIRPCIDCKIKKEITTLPIESFTSEEWFISRVNLLTTLETCGITRIIAPKPKADRQMATKIVLKNDTYDESTDTIANEIEDCIGIKPLAIKPLGRAGKIHLLIFDGEYKSRELLANFKNAERKFFCAPTIKVEPYRENPKHIVQCKKCYAFDHSKQSCYGKQEEPQIVLTTAEGTTTKVCRNCKEEDHGANNAKCPVFKNMIARQIEQAEAKQSKKEERIKRSVVRLGVKYADITNTKQFPTLPQKEAAPSPTEQVAPTKAGLTLEGLFQMQTQMQQTLMMLTDTINRIHLHLNGQQ
ncbi:hypothetical protein JYU34_014039 [Plutella xylostella]|uniref:Pre-C2HC domain-containing protein n=1 Tax=Plutella xylostella TaxID=51655 RepID=A0ABQ7Q7I1_PLUXY|nr:hypothetical protein JYU34_014039 [Plutella xylostella]